MFTVIRRFSAPANPEEVTPYNLDDLSSDEENGPVPVPQVNPDKGTPDEENGLVPVPQVTPNKGAPFKSLRNVLTLMNTHLSKNNLCSTPVISLAVLVKASETIYPDSLDSKNVSQLFESLMCNVYKNPTLVSKFDTKAGMAKVFKKWCNRHNSNGVNFLLTCVNQNKNKIKEMCNKNFLDAVQLDMLKPGQPKVLRGNPAKRLVQPGMVNTLKAVTKGSYDTLLDNFLCEMKKKVLPLSDIEEIKENVCELYKKFIEDLKVRLFTNTIKGKDGRWYKASEFQIDFEHQFEKVKNGLGTELRNKLDKETRSNMMKELKEPMRDIFKSLRKR